MVLKRFVLTFSVLLAIVAVSAAPSPASATGFTCHWGATYSLAGTIPSGTVYCGAFNDPFLSYVTSESYAPCGQRGVLRYDLWQQMGGELGGLNPSDFSFWFYLPRLVFGEATPEVRVRAYISPITYIGNVGPPAPLGGTWTVRHHHVAYDTGATYPNGSVSGSLLDLALYSTWAPDIYGHPSNYTIWYLLDVVIPLNGPTFDGLISIGVQSTVNQILPHNLAIGSVQIYPEDSTVSPMCDMPNLFLNSTLTPTPVWSTATPAGATATPWPTAGFTPPPPTPTLTPFAFATFPPRVTPTPLVIPAIPTLFFPGVTWPTLPPPPEFTATPSETNTPAPTSTPYPSSQGTAVADILAVATLWAAPLQAAGETISNTDLISNTTAFFSETVQYVTLPFAIVGGVQEFAPNTWPFYLIILGLVFIRIGVPVIIFILDVITQFIEVVRKVWEALPLN